MKHAIESKIRLLFLVLLLSILSVCAQNITSPFNGNSSTSSAAATSNATHTSSLASPVPISANASVPLANVTVSAFAPAPTTSGMADDDVLPLHTIVDPAFGIAGVLLILSGLPLAFIGHRSQWYVCATTGFYTLQIVALAFILRFGQARAVVDPTTTVRGLFLLACLFAGLIGAVLSLIFQQAALLLTSAFGGYALSLLLQACRPGGLIRDTGLRYVLYIACLSTFYIVGCVKRLQPYTIIFASAIVGTTATVLGIDCFTRANLKEFYIRNLGYDDLFEKRYPDAFAHHRWPISPGMTIELGVIVGVTCMALAFQSKTWLQERKRLAARQSQDLEQQHQEQSRISRAKAIFARAQHDLRLWKGKHNECDRETETLATMTSPTLAFADHDHAPPPKIELDTTSAHSTHLLSPSMAASMGIVDSVTKQEYDEKNEEIKDKEKLLDEIAAIRQSICELRSSSRPGSVQLDALSDYRALATPTPPMFVRENRLSSASWTPTPPPPPPVAEVSRKIEAEPLHGNTFEQSQSHSHEAQDTIARRTNASTPTPNAAPAAPAEQEEHSISLVWPAAQIPEKRQRTQSASYAAAAPTRVMPFPERTVIGTPAVPFYTTTGADDVGGSGSQNRRASLPRPRVLTGDELQARHNKRLSNMQRPLSMQLNEAAALERAKEEWHSRKLEERRYWLQKYGR